MREVSVGEAVDIIQQKKAEMIIIKAEDTIIKLDQAQYGAITAREVLKRIMQDEFDLKE